MMPLLLVQTHAAYDLRSPSGLVQAQIVVEPGGKPTLAVLYRGKRLLDPGRLGLDLAQGGPLDSDLRVVSSGTSASDTTWQAVTGKASAVRDHYRERCVALEENAGSHRRFTLILRAYDDGVAFQYQLSGQKGLKRFDVREELTEFRPVGAPKATALVLPNTSTPYEEPYQTGTLPSLDGKLIGFPLLLQYPTGPSLAFTEANLDDFPGLYLRPEGGILKAHLSPRLDGSGLAAQKDEPFQSP